MPTPGASHDPTKPLDAAVRLAILDGFLAGDVPTVTSVASAVGATASATAASFERLAAGRAIVLVPGTHELLMAAPFAGRPTDFRVRVGERSYHANCIWDALGVPAMLAAAGRASDADVGTECADCGESLAVRVRNGAVESEPPGAVAHFAVPAGRWWADIVFT